MRLKLIDILSEESIFVPRRLEDRSLDDLSVDLFRKLMRLPELADQYDNILNHIHISLVAILIVNHPKLFYHFDHRIGEFTPSQIQHILSEVPDLAERFANPDEGPDRLGELSREEVSELIKKRPQLYKYFEGRDNLDLDLNPDNLTNDSEVLSEENIFIPRRLEDRSSTTRYVYNILITNPESVEQYEHLLGDLESYELRLLLQLHPQLMFYLDDKVDNLIDEFEPNDIYALLKGQPQFIDHFKDVLDKLTINHILVIITYHPDLVNHFRGRLDKLSSEELKTAILYAINNIVTNDQPKLIEVLKDWLGILSDDQVVKIIQLYPKLSKYFDPNIYARWFKDQNF